MRFDLAIVGAGPAGSAAAIIAARLAANSESASLASKLSIALIDKAIFPRGKVCGSCLSPAGVISAKQLGLGDVLQSHGEPIRSMTLDTGSRVVRVPVSPGGVAIERSIFDTALMHEAQRQGVTILQGMQATISRLSQHGATLCLTKISGSRSSRDPNDFTLDARVLIAADGLSGSLDDPQHPQPAKVWKHSRIGLGCLIAPAIAHEHLAWLAPGQMHMLTHARGYAGLVKLRDGRVDLAAAVDPAFVRASAGPVGAMAAILASSRQTAPLAALLSQCVIRGVPPLTRQRVAQQGCLLRVGDSLRYAEPFSGEGMSWALKAGMLAGEHACRVLSGQGDCSQWPAIVHAALSPRQRRCMMLARLLRVPRAISAAAWCMQHVPAASQQILATLGGPWGGQSHAFHAAKAHSQSVATS